MTVPRKKIIGRVAAQAERIIMLYKSGRTTGQIAKEIGGSVLAVRKQLKLAGIHDATFNPMRGNYIARGMESDICRLYTDGLSSCEIGLHYGIAPQTILKTLYRHNVRIRSRDEIPVSP